MIQSNFQHPAKTNDANIPENILYLVVVQNLLCQFTVKVLALFSISFLQITFFE